MIDHNKCAHFSHDTKERVRWAYNLADDLHSKQERSDSKPYIEHIDRSGGIYLNSTLYGNEHCNAQYLIALILHDCIEDNDIGLKSIIEKGFSIATIVDILWMSKPTKRVISQVMKLQETYPEIFYRLQSTGFIDMYKMVNDNKPESFVKMLVPKNTLSMSMCTALKNLWIGTYRKKYNLSSEYGYQHKIFAEYIFQCMIASMPKELFRIKGTERRDNMQDIAGLLRPEKVDSAKGTMLTTMEIYVPRARELGDIRLAKALIEDREKEYSAFVESKLLQPAS